MTDTLNLPSINVSETSDDNLNIDSYNSKRTSDSSLHPNHSHTWWDESQLDLDLADDPILTVPTNKKQKLKEKFMGTMRHHQSQPQHPHQQRTSWVSSSSTNSSLYSTQSVSTSTRSKLSRSFLQLRQWIIKKY